VMVLRRDKGYIDITCKLREQVDSRKRVEKSWIQGSVVGWLLLSSLTTFAMGHFQPFVNSLATNEPGQSNQTRLNQS